jgi:hypothetical protein
MVRQSDRPGYEVRGSGDEVPPLAVTLHDVVIHDVRKWFGGADLRLDALVVHGATHSSGSIYQAGTFRFPRVRDGESLPIDAGGLLLFLGRPTYFLDIFVVVSRDRTNNDDLAVLLQGSSAATDLADATQAVVDMGVAVPAVAAAAAGLRAAGAIGALAHAVLKAAAEDAIGLYRASWLQFRDAFGVGPHPEPPKVFRVHDLSFRYEIAIEESRDGVAAA